jgi:hypothetical protein
MKKIALAMLVVSSFATAQTPHQQDWELVRKFNAAFDSCVEQLSYRDETTVSWCAQRIGQIAERYYPPSSEFEEYKQERCSQADFYYTCLMEENIERASKYNKVKP